MIVNPVVQGGGGAPEQVTGSVSIGRYGLVVTYSNGESINRVSDSGTIHVLRNSIIEASADETPTLSGGISKYDGSLYFVTGDFTISVS